MTKLKKIVWPILLLALLTLAAPPPMSAGDVPEPGPQYPPGEEVIAARGAYSKTFRNEGQDTIYLSTTPLHYYDEGAKDWREIDTTLETQTQETDDDNAPYRFRCFSNSSKILMPKHGNGWVRIRSGENVLDFKLVSDRPRMFNRKGQSALRYTDLLPGCDLDLEVKPGGLKEDIILKSPNTAPRKFEYRIRLRNLEVSQTDTGEILFTDNKGEPVFMTPKLFMYDSAKVVSEDIRAELKKEGNEYRLTIIPSQNWLSDPQRVYPVTIDPTTITVNGKSPSLSGYNCRFIYYLPSNHIAGPVDSITSERNQTNNGTIYINNFDDLFCSPLYSKYAFPYKIRVKFTAWSSNGSNFTDYTPASFSIYNWDKNADSDASKWRISTIYTTNFGYGGGSRSGEFYLDKGQAAQIELKSATFRWWTWSSWSTPCGFTLTCQKESMSPKPPLIQPLPPETPGSSVTLRWNPAEDDWNEKAWDEYPWKKMKDDNVIPATLKAGDITRYIVQCATDPSFTYPTTMTLKGAQINVDENGLVYLAIPNLTQGQTYYFRVCAGDDEENPLNMNPWDEINNPSGPRWSAVTTTTLVAPPAAGAPDRPAITGMTPVNPDFQDGPRDYCNSSTPAIAWNQANPARICAVAEPSLAKYYTTINTTAGMGELLPLPDGDYVVYVQTTNSAGNSLWSEGRRLTIDTKPPVISTITEQQDGDDVILKFTSSEPVKAAVYWNLKETPETHLPESKNYLLYHSDSSLTIPGVYQNAGTSYYYRVVFYDQSMNLYDTPTVQLGGGPGNNIPNTGTHFGLDPAWTYQTFDLGRAGSASVNANNGNLVVAATDFAIPGRGLPLALTRYYNSLVDYQGILGTGWRTSFEMYLEVNGQNITICDPDGSAHTFTRASDTQFTRPPGDFRRVARNTGDETYTVTEPNGTKYYFAAPQNGKARLNQVVDRFGNTLALNYDSSGYLTSVAEPSGRITALFHHDYYEPVSGKNLLSRIDFTPLDPGAPDSRYIKYQYQHGRLVEVRYPSDTATGDGPVEITVNYSYDSVVKVLNSSRVCLKEGAAIREGSIKNETTFAYKCTKRSLGAISTWFSNYYGGGIPVTRQARYYFDYNGDITTVTDPRGNQWKYAHFGYGHVNNGQCQSVEAPACYKPDGTIAVKPATVYYAYDSDSNLKTVKQQKNVYDPVANLNTLRDVVTTYEFNSTSGNLEKVIVDDGDPRQGCKRLTAQFTYETPANAGEVLTDLAAITDPRNHTTTYTNIYTNGKLSEITIVPPPANPPDPYTITHTFNQYGERTDKNIKISGTSKYNFGYGYQNGLLTGLTNAYGSTTYYYTLYGERSGILDANKVRTQSSIFYYTGNQTAVHAPWEDMSQKPVKDFDNYSLQQGMSRIRFTYDANGNKTSESDVLNNITHYYYDEQNRLSRVQSPYVAGMNQYNSYNHYDENGNLVETLDYNSQSTKYQYDAANRRTQVKDALGKIMEELEYDEANRVKRRWDAGKLTHIDYYYDSADNLLSAEYFDRNNALVHTVKYYKIDGGNQVISYDRAGNLLTKSVPLNAREETGTLVTDYQYDALNRPISINTSCQSNARYTQTVNYTYEAGQIKTMSVSVNGGTPRTYTYIYDLAQRLDSIINPSGQKFKFDYFAGGQRKNKSIYKQSADTNPFMTVDYRYDAAYLLKNLNYRWGAYKFDQGYVYDQVDKIIDNQVGYDVTAPDVSSYLKAQLPPNNGYLSGDFSGSYHNQYTYDELGRLTSSDIRGINPVLKYDTRLRRYDRRQSTSYSLIDGNSNPYSKTTKEYEIDKENEGLVNTTYESNTPNPLNQIIQKKVSVTGVSATPEYTINLQYHENGSLELEDYPIDIRITDSQFQYGLEQQLVRTYSRTDSTHQTITVPQLNVPVEISCYYSSEKWYTYELGGKLLRVKSNIHDSVNPYYGYPSYQYNYNDYFYYTHDGVVAERHDDIDETKYFTRLGGELLACDNNGQSYFYIQNIRGDVIMLVGSGGLVKSIRDYDASGQVLSKAPGHVDRDPFGFTGGLDAGDGLWKLGARFYDSSKGSFIQQDRYIGDPSDPLSLNRYVYCGLDPVNFIDPTGFSRTGDFALGLSWLTMIDGPVLPIGDIIYASVVAGIAIGEYGPMLIDFGSKMYQSANSGSSGGSSGGLDPGNWGKGSFKSAIDSLQKHFQKHGAEVGAKDAAQYLRKAEAFKNNLKGATSYEIDGYTEGVIRYVKNGKYIDLAPDGTIISFGSR